MKSVEEKATVTSAAADAELGFGMGGGGGGMRGGIGGPTREGDLTEEPGGRGGGIELCIDR